MGNFAPDLRNYYEDLRRKEEDRLKQIDDKEMVGFTGKPIINKKS